MESSRQFAEDRLAELLATTKRPRLLKSVVVINGGGTISMEAAPVRTPSQDLYVRLQQRIHEFHPARFEILHLPLFERPPDSSTIGGGDWLLMLRVVKALLSAKREAWEFFRKRGVQVEQGGMVITHGTDTLPLTALSLSLAMAAEPLAVPIILTGSHLPLDADGTDAYTNLLRAIYCAQERFTEVQPSLPPGLYVLIGSDIHLGSRITKTRTSPDEEGNYVFSFPAPAAQVGGPPDFRLTIDQEFLESLKPETASITEQVIEESSLGCVEHIVFDCFADPEILDDLRRRFFYYRAERAEPRLGVVIQGDFSGHKSWAKVSKLLAAICEMEVYVYLGSRRVWEKLGQELEDPHLGLIHRSLSHTKAQTKLRWILRKARLPEEVHEEMAKNLAGEIVATEKLPEWIKYENFPEQKGGTGVVIVYPDIDPRVLRDAVWRLDKGVKKHKDLFVYGFGDGHVPAPRASPISLVSEYLEKENLTGKQIHSASPEVEAIAREAEKVLSSLGKKRLRDYVADRYEARPEVVRRRVRGELQRRKQLEMVERFSEYIASLVEEFERQYQGQVRIRHSEKTAEALRGKIRLEIPKAVIQKEVVAAGKSQLASSKSWIPILVDNFRQLVAQRIVKDAIANSSLLLSEVGSATDRGIHVHIKSLAVLSPTDTRLYEIGGMLRALGVDSDRCRGWRTDYLLPKGGGHKKKSEGSGRRR